MAFFIPPVFLFGNNANRFHNEEKKKAKYKTATETEIQIENRNIKRIVELEEENRRLKYEISKYNEIEEHIEDWLLTPIPNAWSHEEEIKRLKIENKNLKEENKKFDKLKIRVYKNLHKDMWKEYQKFCEKNNI